MHTKDQIVFLHVSHVFHNFTTRIFQVHTQVEREVAKTEVGLGLLEGGMDGLGNGRQIELRLRYRGC